MIDRRRFIEMMAASAAALSACATTPSAKTWRLAYLSFSPAPAPGKPDVEDAMWVRLRELGYVEGTNLVVERRYSTKTEAMPELAAELVRFNPDVFVSRAVPANLAAKAATSTIPIVMATGIDPVREGIVASYEKPGGNITGMMFGAGKPLIEKRLQLLQEVVPGFSRLAFVPGIPGQGAADNWIKDMGEVAPPLGVKVQIILVKDPSNWNDAFAEMLQGQAQAVYAIESPQHIANAKHIADLAIKHRMPSMFGLRQNAEAGGLMSYGVNIPDVFRRAADIVDKVLKGAKPADLPIEAGKNELVINLATARAIGVTVPSALLAKADTVIQ
jgi:putative ABC transport system substrate-binding protein